MQPHRLNIYALRPCTNNARFCRVDDDAGTGPAGRWRAAQFRQL